MTRPRHLQVELALDARAELGEGPVWCLDEAALYWVDINRGRVHRYEPNTGVDLYVDIGEPVGAVAPRSGGGIVMATQSGFLAMASWMEPPFRLAKVESERLDTRMNDGACDSRGRFWAGTLHLADSAQGSLYRLNPDGSVETMLRCVSISNGIAWSPDDTLMYYVDSATHGVDVFDFNAEAGEIANRRRLIEVEPATGLPDGLVVDREGGLWLAIWDGWAVHHYKPDGTLATVVDVPVAKVTKCAFGGPSLDQLFITTAQNSAVTPTQPHAGGVFIAHPPVEGLPSTPFGA